MSTVGATAPVQPFAIRDFVASTDAAAVNAVALAAFEQFQHQYDDWPAFKARLADTASLAESGELIVATSGTALLGAVAYVGPGRPKAAFFLPEWPVMRMLVVSPAARGQGVGRALAEACIARANRDGARAFALHTSPVMSVALPMYLRMGFEWRSDLPDIAGVPYALYVKRLD